MNSVPRVGLMVATSLLIAAGSAYGDGKFFVSEKVPVDVPYQRAFLRFSDGRETLMLQSKYELAESTDSLGWVVPIPTVPEIDSMDAETARSFFMSASMRTRPNVTHVLPYMAVALFFLSVAVCLLTLLDRPFLIRRGTQETARGRQAAWAVGLLVMSLVLIVVSAPKFGTQGVEVVKAQKAGIYDVQVIRGDNTNAVTDWLKSNGFAFAQADVEALRGYVDRGWCFVTARIGPDADVGDRKVVSQGLVAPLILEFETQTPIYPLALTATVGTRTEVLLYTLSESKLGTGGRLPLRAAVRSTWGQPASRPPVDQPEQETQPVLPDAPRKPMMLCKFKGRLTAEQMREDLEFVPAADNQPYRERKVVW